VLCPGADEPDVIGLAAAVETLVGFEDRAETYQEVSPLTAEHTPDLALQIETRLLSEPFTAMPTDAIPIA
jgi:hypothetical protein